ncbi:MAG TPA: DNA alkylation repair protein, partial [Clostridiaceae bacterium]|nr:DNA alkylation repair protein [Clostridiaceae bacterium]
MQENSITAGLFLLQDPAYRDFMARLIPTADKETIIGVRSPALKKYAASLAGSAEADSFLLRLP